MTLENNIIEMVLNAEAKALATCNEKGINVIPVSTVKVMDDQIILVNYFMGKTLENIKSNSEVALACWSGLSGYQIKAQAEYQTEGEIFNDIEKWIADILPERVVKGILVLKPHDIFDVSASTELAGKRIL